MKIIIKVLTQVILFRRTKKRLDFFNKNVKLDLTPRQKSEKVVVEKTRLVFRRIILDIGGGCKIKTYIMGRKYRPVSLENYIGNEHLKTKVSKYINTENDIPHLLLHGKDFKEQNGKKDNTKRYCSNYWLVMLIVGELNDQQIKCMYRPVNLENYIKSK